MSEINVTPFVDVMLVLLVIFMITAPLLATGVQVDLPKAQTQPVEGQDEPVAVTIDREGRVFIGDQEIDLDALVLRLRAINDNNPEVRIFVRGDHAIDYGRVMTVVGAIHSAGFTKVALLTHSLEPPLAAAPRGPNRG